MKILNKDRIHTSAVLNSVLESEERGKTGNASPAFV